MPDDKSAPRFDAVLVPADYPAGKAEAAKLIALKDEFGPLLGSRRVHSRTVGNRQAMLTAGVENVSRYHRDGLPNSGDERYEWLDRGDGRVFYGLLTPEAKAQDAADASAADPAAAQRRAVSADGMAADRTRQVKARHAELAAKAGRSAAEDAELGKLGRFLSVLAPAPAPQPAPQPAPAPAPPAPQATVPDPAGGVKHA